jgi:histidine phosphotransferase ChpT
MPSQGVGRFTANPAFISSDDRAASTRDGVRDAQSQLIDMRLLELLTARLCHELSGPVAAINNGIELLFDEAPGPDPSMALGFLRDAVALVGDSAHRVRNRLQFYRFAYGFGGRGANTGAAPHELASGFFAATRIACDYAEGIRKMSPEWQKLACNLLPVGAEALPRGGRLSLTDNPLAIEAVGEAATLSPEAQAALALSTPIAELTVRTVQAYFTGLLAEALACRLTVMEEPGRVRLATIRAEL